MAEHFEIVDQHQTFVPGVGARFGQVMEITFKTKPTGIVRMIEIPLDQYNAYDAKTIHDMIEPLAIDAEAKHNM